MADHPNAATIRQAAQGMEQGGDPMWRTALLADDVVWHEIGSDEPVRGKAALVERWSVMPEGVSFTDETHDVLGSDDHAVQLVTARVTMGEQSITYRTAEIFHMKDGKITERWAFSDDTDRINRFFGGS